MEIILPSVFVISNMNQSPSKKIPSELDALKERSGRNS
jgi:hypothetical protein